MASFLYYVPGGKRGIRVADVPELAYAFEVGLLSHDIVADGLDGGAGVIIAERGFPAERLGYYPDRQTWRRVPGTRYHVGVDRERMPRPEELARQRPVNGHLVRLADGREWLVPMAIQHVVTEQDEYVGRSSALPTSATLDDDGRWVAGEPLAKYAQLWEIACAWWDQVMAGVLSQVPEEQNAGTGEWDSGSGKEQSGERPSDMTVSFAFERLMESACEVLAVNYRVGPAEISMLRLLDEQTATAMLQAAVDWPTLMRWLEKKTAAGRSSTSGG